MGTRGIGRLFFRGTMVWFQISIRGVRYRVSTEIHGDPAKAIPKEAELWRAKKLVELGQGGSVRSDQVTFDALADALEARYRAENRASLGNAINRLKYLRAYFGHWRAVTITTSEMAKYGAKRRDVDHAAIATVNLEIALAARAFSVALEDRVLQAAPRFHRLPGENVRQGIVEGETFRDISEALAEKYRAVAWFLHLTGWRRSEPCRLRWPDLSWETKDLLLSTSKTGQPRRLPFKKYRALHLLLKRQRDYCDELQAKLGRIIEWVFPQPDGRQTSDDAFYEAWKFAAKKAGHPSAMPHDFRRSIARKCEMTRSPRKSIMALMGVKSEAVFLRYAQLTTADLEDALEYFSEADEPESKVKRGNFGG